MPVCVVCHVEKELSEFNMHSYCRECSRAYGKRYYQANKAYYLEKAKRRNAEQRKRLDVIINAAKDRPCADCGIKYPPWIMQFDHLEGADKIANVADMRRLSYSIASVMDEIAKCDVVCANCHCQRTHERYEQQMKSRANAETCAEE